MQLTFLTLTRLRVPVILRVLQALCAVVMATRTVRLDDEAEHVLASLTRSTGLSISEVLKRGLMAYKEQAQNAPAPRAPYDVFRRLDLGPGGYARAPARDAKAAVRAAVARKHGK
jgi:hypothetical protein